MSTCLLTLRVRPPCAQVSELSSIRYALRRVSADQLRRNFTAIPEKGKGSAGYRLTSERQRLSGGHAARTDKSTQPEPRDFTPTACSQRSERRRVPGTTSSYYQQRVAKFARRWHARGSWLTLTLCACDSRDVLRGTDVGVRSSTVEL
eukprot:5625199-Prymnesium_polylepis.1